VYVCVWMCGCLSVGGDGAWMGVDGVRVGASGG